jgi:hypothetical protein
MRELLVVAPASAAVRVPTHEPGLPAFPTFSRVIYSQYIDIANSRSASMRIG